MSTHGSYETVDGRPAVRFERRLRHPVETVWQAVTDPAELAHWFPATVQVDLRVGGAIAFSFDERHASDASGGDVVELDPPRRFAFTWDGDLLRFELTPDGAGCVLVFTHVIDDAAAAARNAAGWHVCLDALATRLERHEPAAPPPSGPTPEWEAHYAEYQRRGMPAGAPVPGA